MNQEATSHWRYGLVPGERLDESPACKEMGTEKLRELEKVNEDERNVEQQEAWVAYLYDPKPKTWSLYLDAMHRRTTSKKEKRQRELTEKRKAIKFQFERRRNEATLEEWKKLQDLRNGKQIEMPTLSASSVCDRQNVPNEDWFSGEYVGPPIETTAMSDLAWPYYEGPEKYVYDVWGVVRWHRWYRPRAREGWAEAFMDGGEG